MNKQTEVAQKGKIFVGKVVSIKMQKTIVVEVLHTHQHALYRKAMRRTKRFAAHNELTGIQEGDTVKITEVRPISKTKHFRVVEKIS